jgi:hypothetical protein
MKERTACTLTEACYPVQCRRDVALCQQEALKTVKINHVYQHTVVPVNICQLTYWKLAQIINGFKIIKTMKIQFLHRLLMKYIDCFVSFRSPSFYLFTVRVEGFYFHLITLKHTPQSVGLLWTRDRPVAETST